jgi:hypothetical protein
VRVVIPANLDYLAILADLNDWGIRDYKIEAICGFGVGHVAQLKCGAIKDMKYPNAARLYNFWFSEAQERTEVPRETSRSHTATATTV